MRDVRGFRTYIYHIEKSDTIDQEFHPDLVGMYSSKVKVSPYRM